MTRKDYTRIAAVILSHRQNDDGTGSGLLASLTDSLACIMESDNPRFDRAKFFQACGMDSDGLEWVA